MAKPSDPTREPFLLLAILVLFLAGLSFSPQPSALLGRELRRVDLFADLRRPPPPTLERPRRPPALPARDSSAGLTRFVAALDALQARRRRTVRIAWFGDSQIEADLVTEDVRDSLQHLFGGHGPGFVPIASVAAGSRTTVVQSFSGDWTDRHLLTRGPGARPGLSGHVFLPRVPTDSADTAFTPSWTFLGVPRSRGIDSFWVVRLLHGPARGARVAVGGRLVRLPSGGRAFATELARGVRRLKVTFLAPRPFEVWGLSLESDSGVFLDNFSFRGSTGLTLDRIPVEHLRAMDSLLGYDLVVLEYGVNVANYRTPGFGWYERGMDTVIARLRRGFPRASILVVGVSDRGLRDGAPEATDPAVPRLLRAQRELAARNGCAFLDLYQAMGGPGTMARWAEKTPPWANPDLTHFSRRGSGEVGRILADSLISAWRRARRGRA